VAGLRRILLVEDDPPLREMYQLYLTGQGYEVGIAEDGEEALTMAKSFKPDLIFLDIMMPKRNGFDVLKILRTDKSYMCTTCKIVILTNLSDDKIPGDVKDMMDSYVIKAEITLSDLVEIINSFGK
jgi:DNA-binding response OmpR family regulator